MTQTDIQVRFFLDKDAINQVQDVHTTYSDQYPFGCSPIESQVVGDSIELVVPIPETILESLSPDELIEYVGIDSEFLIHLLPED